MTTVRSMANDGVETEPLGVELSFLLGDGMGLSAASLANAAGGPDKGPSMGTISFLVTRL